MSNTIDRKVVEMQFDNSQFEKNVKGSLSTLDKLKSSLNFDGLSKGLDDLDKSAGKLDFSGMRNAVDTVSYKFSAFEAMALGALMRIGERAVDVGIKFAKSLSVDNITAGWSKFEDKTRSVGTLIAQGFDMNVVNDQLDRLNWYTDETSYSFTDMVAEIAKFTATGKGLEDSVDAMMGIANWAALSGQNAQTASRAMYQLSQAMGSGVMRKEDYKSIQNASMDTAEFRQKALDAGVALGTLQKNADGTYRSIVDGAKSSDFTMNQFADHLTEDAWFTSEVMMTVFRDYGGAIDELYSYAEKHGITASQAIEEMGDTLDEFALKAFKAAQEARSWTDVVDSVKEAVASGFMQTFEIIFGQYDEAVVLWTDLANRFYDVFAEPINVFNEKLDEGLKQSTPYVDKYLSTVFGTETGIIKTIRELAESNEGFSIMDEQIQARIKGMVHGDDALTKLVTDYTKLHHIAGDSEMATGANMDVMIAKAAEMTGVSEKQIKSLKKLGEQYGYNSEKYKNAVNNVLSDSSDATKEIISGLLGVTNGIDFLKSTDLNPYLNEMYGLTHEQVTELSKLAEEYGVNSDQVNDYIDNLKDLKTAGFGDKNAAKDTIKALLELTNGVSEMSYAWKSGDVVGYISEMTGMTTESIKELKGLVDEEKNLKNAELDSEEAIQKNAEALAENQKKIEELADTLSEGDEAMKEQILTLLRFEGELDSLSGYNNILQAFNNVWDYLASILETVKDAFSEVFPPLTAERIYAFTERLKEASEKLVLTEENAEKLKKAFKGFFSIFKIIGQAIRPVIIPIKAFFNELIGDGAGLLEGAANIGEWITKLAESGKVAEVSEKIFTRLGEIVRVVVRSFKDLFDIQEVIAKYNEAGGGIQGVFAVIKEKLKDLAMGVINFISVLTGWDPTNFLKAVKKVFNDIKGFFKKIFGKDDSVDESTKKFEKFSGALEKVRDVLSTLKEGFLKFVKGIKNFFSNLGKAVLEGDFSHVFEGLAKVLKTIWGFISKMAQKIGPVLVTVFKKIGEAFSGLGDKLGSLESGDVMGFLDRFIEILARLVEVILGLKGIDAIEGIIDSFVGNFKELGEAMTGAFDSFTKKNELKQVQTMAIAMFLLATSIMMLASIPTAKLAIATGAIAAVMEVLTSAMKKLEVLGKSGGLAKNKFNSSALVKVAAAVLIVAFALKQFKDLDAKHIVLGTAAITAIMYALVGVAKVLSNTKHLKGAQIKKAATGLVILAVAIRLVVWSIKEVVKLIEKNPSATLKAMIAVVALIGVMTAVAAILSKVKNPRRVTKAAIGLAALAIALRLVIWSVKAVVKLIEKNPNSALQAMIAVGAMLVVMSGIAMLLSTTKHSGRVLGKAIGLIALALALRLIIWSVNAVVKTLSGNPNTALQAMISVGAILLAMSGIAMLLSATKHSGRVLSKAMGLIVLALAVRLILVSVSKMAEMIGSNPNATLQALIAVGAMLVVLTGVAVILSKTGGGATLMASSAALIGMAIALGILAAVVKSMSSMSWGDLIKGLVAFAAIMAIIVVSANLLKPVTKTLLVAAGAFVLIAAGVVLLGAGLMLLGLGLDTIAGSITAFAAAFAASSDLIMFAIETILTGIIGLIPLIAVKIGEGIINILKVIADAADTVAEVVVTLVRAALKSLKETIPEAVDTVLELVVQILQSLVDKTPELVDLLFQFVVGLIDGLARNLPDLIGSVVNLIESIIKGLVDALNDLDIGSPEELLNAALKLGEIMLVLNGLALLTPGALIGVAGVAAVALEVVGILALFSEINDTAGTIEYLARGADLLEAVGNAIGRFVGAIIGGAAEAMSKSLPAIGKNLATFMKNAAPFFEKASSLDPNVADGVMHLAAAILVLTATEFVNGILDFFGLGVDWGELGNKFALLGEAIKSFAESTEGINADSFSAVADAMDPLVTLATGLPNTEGLWGWISGKQDIGEFGQKLGDLATGMATFANAAAAIPADAQQSMINCANALVPVVDMSNNLPNTEGAWGWISGKQDIGEFGQKLGDLATGMAIFAEASANIPADAQQAMINCANALVPVVDMSNNLPNTEGAWGWISGKQDIAEFGKKLADLAYGMMIFANQAAKIPADAQTAMMACANALVPVVDLSNNLPNTEGAWGWISGKQDLAEFGRKLGDLAYGMVLLANQANGISPDSIAAIAALVPVCGSLAQMSQVLPNSEGLWGWLSGKQDLGDFANNLGTFGWGVANMASQVSGISSSTVTAIVNTTEAAKKLADLSASNPDSGKLKKFADSLPEIGESLNNFSSKFGNTGVGRGLTTAVSNIDKVIDLARRLPSGAGLISFASGLNTMGNSGVSNMISAFNNSHSRVKSSINSLLSDALSKFNSFTSSFKTKGQQLIQSFIDGMENKKSAVYYSAYKIGKRAVEGLNDGINAHSPSKAAEKSGNYFTRGFINGANEFADAAEASGRGVGESALKGLSDAISDAGEGLDGRLDGTITIRPVMDLSEIQNGVEEASGILDGLSGYTIGGSTDIGRGAQDSMGSRGKTDTAGDFKLLTKAVEQLGDKLDRPNQTNNFTFNGLTNQEIIREVKKSLTNDIIKEGRKWA